MELTGFQKLFQDATDKVMSCLKKKLAAVDLTFLFLSCTSKSLGETAQKNNLTSLFFLFSSRILRQSHFAPADNRDCVTGDNILL